MPTDISSLRYLPDLLLLCSEGRSIKSPLARRLDMALWKTRADKRQER